jgi:small subunit ribosomal protein S4
VARNDTPPGPRGGDGGRRKSSQYAIRLKEKQKLRFNYGITESQLIRYVREARRVKGSTGEVLLQLLEMRLDNIVYRLGFLPTIAAARQAIRHGHILLNDKKATIPSHQCHPQDTILISPKKRSQPLIDAWLTRKNRWMMPPHLRVDHERNVGVVNGVVDRAWVGLEGRPLGLETVSSGLNELLVVEFYSRKL